MTVPTTFITNIVIIPWYVAQVKSGKVVGIARSKTINSFQLIFVRSSGYFVYNCLDIV